MKKCIYIFIISILCLITEYKFIYIRRRKEIWEPLEDANTTIAIMENKLRLREDFIKQLRRYIASELIQVKMNGPEDTRLRNIEANKDEMLKVITLKDEIAKLEFEITSKNTEINKLKNVITYQADKIHRITLNEEKISFTYKEKFRKLEKEKNSLKNQAQVLVYENEELKLQIDKLESELSSSTALLQSKEFEIDSNNHLIESLRIELKEITHERDSAVTNLLETEYNWESLNGELAGLKEANKQLIKKYVIK